MYGGGGDVSSRWLVDVVLAVAMVREGGIDKKDKGRDGRAIGSRASVLDGGGRCVGEQGGCSCCCSGWLVIPVVVFGGDNDLEGSCLG